jgi:hypothetical protein
MLGIATAFAAAAATAALSRVPYTPEGSESAVVRLSWRTTGKSVEECREASPEELEHLPAHMRQSIVCEGRAASYHLRVAIDGRPLVDELVSGRGEQGDRPIYVYRDLAVTPGTHRLEVDFAAVAPPDGGSEGIHREAEEHEEIEEKAPQLTLDVPLALGARRIALVTYDAELQQLVLTAGGASRH